MLQKRRFDEKSLPDGLMKTKEALTKGMIVARNLESGEYKITKPTDTAGTNVYGFVTLREDEAVYKQSYYDEIPANTRAVVYTLVPNAEWATDQFEGELSSLNIGDKMFANTTGKLKKVSSSETALFELIGKQEAMAGYENAMVIVKVLP